MLKMTTALVLSTTLMTSSIPMPFNKAKGLIVEDNIQIEELKLKEPHAYKTPKTINLEEEFEKAIIEKQKREEAKRKEEQRLSYEKWLEENTYNIEFVITHYGKGGEENGGFEGITCTGKPLVDGMVASNYYKLGTVIEFEDGSRVVVSDTGGKNFNSPTRLDKFVDTYDQNYLFKLGKKTLKGRIVK